MNMRPWHAILAGGLIAGTLDIIYAIVWVGMYGRSPQWVLQSVASGWLGKDAFSGGWTSAALGLASHYGISLCAAAIFVVASRRLTALARHWIVAGALYGMGVYLVMSYVVVPLSAATLRYPSLPAVLQGFVSHALLFGLPIAFFARRPRPGTDPTFL